MRSYHQYCALARALDVVGDRWTLLIVRELSLRPCRYRDLRDGLPGIATNLLAERLRELEAAEVVVRREPEPPVATAVYELGARGRSLLPVLDALAVWGTPYMVQGQGDDEFRGRWVGMALGALVRHAGPEPLPACTIRVDIEGERTLVELDGAGGVRARAARADESVDVEVSGPPDAVLAHLFGGMPLAQARRAGVRVHGDRARLDRIRAAVAPMLADLRAADGPPGRRPVRRRAGRPGAGR